MDLLRALDPCNLPDGPQMRVLVLDGEPRMPTLKPTLVARGITVLEPTSTDQARKVIDKGVDGAIVDLLSDYGGLGLIEHIRASHHRPVPVILLTSQLDVAARIAATRLNAQFVLKPPLTVTSLVDYLEVNRAAQHLRSGIQEATRPTALQRTIATKDYPAILRRHNDNISAAAREIGITRQALQNYLRRHGGRRS